MILDSSAILAVLFQDAQGSGVITKVMSADSLAVGAPTLAETAIVLGRRLGFERKSLLYRFLQGFEVVVLPFGDRHWEVAMEAYQRYGKGRHRASLNLGDCMTYASARMANSPLLFVGEDFAHTDLVTA